MLKFKLDGKEYKVAEGWHEVTLEKAIGSIPVAEKMPDKLYSHLYKKGTEETTDDDALEFAEFYKLWFSYWSGVPLEIAGKMAWKSTKNNLGMLDIFRLYLVKFLGIPAEQKAIGSFKLKGITYKMPVTFEEIQSKPMPEGSFDELIDSIMVKKAYEETKEYDFTNLPTLTAMLFRPVKKVIKKGRFTSKKVEIIEPYDADTVTEREQIFKKHLTMDKAWAAYFFLFRWSNLFLEPTQKLSSKKAKVKLLVR